MWRSAAASTARWQPAALRLRRSSTDGLDQHLCEHTIPMGVFIFADTVVPHVGAIVRANAFIHKATEG